MSQIHLSLLFLFSLFFVGFSLHLGRGPSGLNPTSINIGNMIQTTLNPSVNITCSDATYSDVCSILNFPNSYWISGEVSLSNSNDRMITFSFSDLSVDSFAKKYLDDSSYSLAKKLQLTSIAVNNPSIVVFFAYNSLFTTIKFSASINLLGFDNIGFDFFIKKENKAISVFAGVELPWNSLTKIVNSVIPADVSSVLDIFAGSSLVITLATDVINFKLMKDIAPKYLILMFANVYKNVEKGLTLYAKISLTNGDNKITDFLKKYLGDVALDLVISISTEKLTGYAGVNSISFGNGIALNKCGIYFQVTNASKAGGIEIGILGELTFPISGSDITFSGFLGFTTTGLKFLFKMIGIYRNAFTIDRFHFGNLNLAAEVSFAGGIPTKFELGGEIAIGKDCYDSESNFVGNGYCLKGEGYVGADAKDPAGNYFYVSLSSITLNTILRAFVGSSSALKITIPAILEKALTFPKALIAQYATFYKSLPNFSLYPGIRVSGEVLLFGVGANVDFSYAPTAWRLSALLNASNINLGGIFTLKGNTSTSGPVLYLNISAIELKFEAYMYVSLTIFGLTSYTYIVFNANEMSFESSGPIFGGSLIATLLVKLTNSDFTNFNFLVSGSIKSNQKFLEMIATISNTVKSKMTAAKADIQKEKDKVTDAQNKLDEKAKAVCGSIDEKCKVQSCAATKEECTEYGTKKECTKQVEECTGGWEEKCTKSEKECTKKVWSIFKWACKAYGTVCKETEDVCKGYGYVCKKYDTVTDYANCKVRKVVCDGYKWTVDNTCKVACEATKSAYDAASDTLTAANGVLTIAQNTIGGLANAADYLAKNAIEIFNIKNASFSVSLNSSTKDGFKGAFDMDFELIIMGKTYKKRINFDLTNIPASIDKIVDVVKDEINSVFK